MQLLTLHEILHAWQIRNLKKSECNGCKLRHVNNYLAEDWKVASYVALLPQHTWSKHVFPYHRPLRRFKPTLMTWDTVKKKKLPAGNILEIRYTDIQYLLFFSHFFFWQAVWLALFQWGASRHVQFIYRRLQMCKATGQVQAIAP